MQLSIKTNFPDVQRALGQLQKDVADKAMRRALNRTVEGARTDMSRQIRAVFNLTAGKVREKLFITRATYKGGRLILQAELSSEVKVDAGTESGRRPINLINFGAKEAKKGVSFKVKRVGGRKVITGTFIGNKGRTVFRRVPGTKMQTRIRYKGDHANKIEPVGTIDVPRMFNTKVVNRAVLAAIRTKFPAIVQREIAFYTSRFSKAGR